MSQTIRVKYNEKPFRPRPTIIQHYYPYTNLVTFSNLLPHEIWEINRDEIVCVWHIKQLH